MFKKLGLIILGSLLFFFSINQYVSAYLDNPIKLNEDLPKLTDEQKQLLKEKQDELKLKYFTNWKDKTREERKIAIKEFQEELDEFCQENFGLPFEQFKEKHHKYFKRILPN